MSIKSNIRIVPNSEIDYEKWDRCIEQSVNFRIYALSWFLDALCPNWPAVVVGDYQYVMPLTTKRKMGFDYVAHPIYAQQLGVFPPPTPGFMTQIMELIGLNHRYIEMCFNSMNIVKDDRFITEKRTNLILRLSQPYNEIRTNYSKHTKRHLKKSETLSLMTSISISDFMVLKKNIPGVEKPYLPKLNLLLHQAFNKNRLKIYGAYSTHNELCAAACFLMDEKRSVYINAVSTQQGKELNAMYAVVDRFIFDYAGKVKWLDFEGSMVDGIARFYKGFGAGDESYTKIIYNQLPLWLKWIKKL